MGIASLSLPVYLAEAVQPEMRGVLGLLPTTIGNAGKTLMQDFKISDDRALGNVRNNMLIKFFTKFRYPDYLRGGNLHGLEVLVYPLCSFVCAIPYLHAAHSRDTPLVHC